MELVDRIKSEAPQDFRIAAMKASKKVGQIFAVNHPGIVEEYRKGATASQLLTEEYKKEILSALPAFSDASQLSVIQNALRCLLDPEEAKIIGKEHIREQGRRKRQREIGIFAMSEQAKKEARSRGGQTSGRQNREQNLGFFALSEDEKQKARAKGGKASGNQAKVEKKGFFALSEKEKQAARERGWKTLRETGKGFYGMDFETRHELGTYRARVQGKALISDQEKEYLLYLVNDPEFQHKTGGNKGLPDYGLISSEIKRWYGLERTNSALRSAVCRLRDISKKQKDKTSQPLPIG